MSMVSDIMEEHHGAERDELVAALTAMKRQRDKLLTEAIKLKPYFTSGNSIPIVAATIKSSELEELFSCIAEIIAAEPPGR